MIIILLLYFFAFCHKRKLLFFTEHAPNILLRNLLFLTTLLSISSEKCPAELKFQKKNVLWILETGWWRDKYFFQYFAYYHINSAADYLVFFHESSLWQFCRVLFCVLSHLTWWLVGWCVSVIRTLSGSKVTLHYLCKHTWINEHYEMLLFTSEPV